MKSAKFTLTALFLFFSMCIIEKTWAQCPPTITQPVNRTICVSTNTNFQTFSTGTVTYQWQEKQGSSGSFTNLTNVAPYSGVTSPTLNIFTVPSSYNGYQYRCVITSTTCSAVYNTNAATLTVNNNTAIDSDPTDTITCAGSTAAFNVLASGANLTYQWQTDNGTSTFSNISASSVYSGVTTSTLLLTGIPSTYSGYKFRCNVSGTCGFGQTSAQAKLTINTPPAITSQPLGDTVCQGTVVTFKLTATGSANLIYQWQENSGSGFVNLSDNLVYIGSGSNTLTIFNVSGGMNGNLYRCIVTDGCSPQATSDVVTLLVNTPPVIIDQTASANTCDGDATKMYAAATGLGVTYQWEVNINSSGYQALVNNATYSGVNTDTLRLNTTNSVMSGNTYRCTVTDGCVPDFNSNDILLSVVVDKKIDDQPHDSLVEKGKNSSFAVHADGANLSYHWQVDNGNGFQSLSTTAYYSGIDADTLKIALTPATLDGYKYRCLVYGGCHVGPIASNAATLSIKWPASVGNTSKDNSGITLYPNPASGKEITIKLTEPLQNAMYRITDEFGNTVNKGVLILSADRTARVNISDLAAGFYMIHVTNNSTEHINTVRFTKQ